jgi:hypothetical protein
MEMTFNRIILGKRTPVRMKNCTRVHNDSGFQMAVRLLWLAGISTDAAFRGLNVLKVHSNGFLLPNQLFEGFRVFV